MTTPLAIYPQGVAPPPPPPPPPPRPPTPPPTPMPLERWFVEGWELTTGFSQDVELRDGLYSSPIARGDNVQVLGSHGSVVQYRRSYDVTSFVAQMWFLEGAWRDAWTAYELLLRAAAIVHRPARWERWLSDGRQQTMLGTISQVLEPASIGQLGIRVQCEVTSQGEPFWAAKALTTDTTLADTTGTLPKVLPLMSKALASAPLADLVYTIAGPITNPTVTVTSDDVLQDSFEYQGTVPAGSTLIVDAGAFTVAGAGNPFVPVESKLVWTGNRYLEVPPAPPGSVPTVTLSGSGGGMGCGLTVAGRDKALT